MSNVNAASWIVLAARFLARTSAADFAASRKAKRR
jgi:hypothetical protein